MKEYKVPIQSLIDHIKTSMDVDQWAKEMAEELLKEQQQIVRCKDCRLKECDGRNGTIVCDITGESHNPDWFCADGERK